MSTKDLIQAELEELDEALLEDIYLFIRTFIRSKQGQSQDIGTHLRSQDEHNSTPIAPHSPDPLEDFIGAVANGSLASNIDNEIYGV